jgi:hypothetical protein
LVAGAVVFSDVLLSPESWPLAVLEPESSPILAEFPPLAVPVSSAAITISLVDNGISRTAGVREEFIRPSESARAVAIANLDWVIASFLLGMTPSDAQQRG